MPTTNPVPSQDPSALLFNAGKLDEVVNGTTNSFTDRLGVSRRTVAGMNADFDAQLANAESDLNVYRADAAASAAEALGYLNVIRTTSYGAYANDPETDPLGNPPTVGDEYFNTAANLLKRWNGTTWQASDINTANLAASSGSSLVGYDGGTVQDVLDGAKSLQDYAALRAYTGRAKRIYVTGLLVTAKPAGIAGVFQYDPTDTTSTDNGGTIIVGIDGRRWRRDFSNAINVKWFGATGNGVTDDTDAGRKAYLALTDNSILVFPPGEYVMQNASASVGAYLSGRKNILISGYGATLKNKSVAANNGFAIWIDQCSNVIIEGFTFDRFNSDLTKKVAGKSQSGVYMDKCSKVTVRSCDFYDVYTGVYIIDSPSWRVEDCKQVGLVNYSTQALADYTISGYLTFVVDSTVNASKHGCFTGNYTDKVFNAIYCEDGDYSVISNNTLKDGLDSQIYAKGAGIAIDGNTVVNPGKDGIKILSNAGGTRGIVSNNVIIKPGKVKADGGYGIIVCDGNYVVSGNLVELDAVANLASILTCGIAVEGYNISVGDNTIIGGGATDNTSGIRLLYGPAYFGDQTDIAITGNVIDASRYGIVIESSPTYKTHRISVCNNNVKNGQYGLYVSGQSADKTLLQNLTIVGNAFYNNIVYAEKCTYAKVSDNNIFKTGSGDGISLVGVDKFDVTSNYIANTAGVGIRADSACTNTYGKMNRFDSVSTPYFGGGIRYDIGSAAPTAGTWAVGDLVWNTAPAAAGAPGWVCITAGTPGTWKAMASLAA